MNKRDSKNGLWVCSTLITLGISFWLFRFALFDLHRMKQFPTILGVVTFAVLIVSLFWKKRGLSIAAVVGYIGGFVAGILFHFDGVDAGGARTNNLWIIWVVFLCMCIIAGAIFEILLKRKKLIGQFTE